MVCFLRPLPFPSVPSSPHYSDIGSWSEQDAGQTCDSRVARYCAHECVWVLCQHCHRFSTGQQGFLMSRLGTNAGASLTGRA